MAEVALGSSAASPSVSVHPRLARAVIAGSMFTMGACGLVYEYIFGTEATYLLGNSIEQFSLIIAVMMFTMGVAAAVQSAIRVELFDRFLLTEIALGVLGGTGPIHIYAAFGMTDHFMAVEYFFVCTVGFCIGLEIPLLVRINQRYASELRVNLANVLSMDYVGALVGALVWTFYLLRSVPLVRVSFILGCINVAVALVGLAVFRRYVVRPRLIGALAVVALAGLVYGARLAPDWTRFWEQRLYDGRVILSQTTRYQHMVLTQWRDRVWFYLNGNLQFSSADEHIYHELLVHPAMALAAPERRRVCILGGGDGLALREVLRYGDVESVTLVDLDPEIVELARTHPVLRALNEEAFGGARVIAPAPAGLGHDGRREVYDFVEGSGWPLERRPVKLADVSVLVMDADLFLRELVGPFDVIIADFPDPSTPELAKLYSREFYTGVRRTLSQHGVLAIQATSPYHAREAYWCIARTLRAADFGVIEYHDHVPSFGEWGWMLAWRSGQSEDAMRSRLSRLGHFDVPLRYLTPEVLQASLAFGADRGPTEGKSINTRMHPVLLQHYLRGWQEDL